MIRSSTSSQVSVRAVDELRLSVASHLGVPVEEIEDGLDLVAQGMDSLGIMVIAGELAKNGHDVTFADMIEDPTMSAWRALLGIGEADGVRADDRGAEPEPLLDAFDLAPMQLAYWTGRQPGMPLGAVGSHFYFEFDRARIEPRELDAAVHEVTSRHPMLRAQIRTDGRQNILSESTGIGAVRDWSTRPETESLLEEVRRRLSHQRLDVRSGQVLDVSLTQLPDRRSRIHLDVDMMVCDAMSFRIVIGDLAQALAEPGSLKPVSYDYRTYLEQRADSQNRRRDDDRRYWGERMDSLPGAPGLPLAQDPQNIADPRTVRRQLTLDAEVVARVSRRCRAADVTLSMFFAAAYAEVVGSWSTERAFLLNLPLFARESHDPQVGSLVGDFSDLIMLEADATPLADFASLARRVQRQFRADAAHSSYRGTELMRDLGRRDGPLTQPAPVVFTSALGMGEQFGDVVRAMLGEPVWMSSQTAGVWIDLQIVQERDGILVNWESVDALFPDGMAESMFGALRQRILALADIDESAWSEPTGNLIPVEQLSVRRRVNSVAGPGFSSGLHERFFDIARSRPDAIALAWGAGSTMSYRQLSLWARRVAGGLTEAGVGDGDRVVVTLPKGPGQVAAVLGVLATGAAYVPVGVEQPDLRRAVIHQRSGAKAIVTTSDRAESAHGLAVVDIETAAPASETIATASAGTPAYLIFTSGSTGEPKGVLVSHGAATNTVDALISHFGLGRSDRSLALSALDFDLSVFDIFGPLRCGGAVVCIAEQERHDPLRWIELAGAHQVTLLNCVPALLDLLATTVAETGSPWPLRSVLLGGDWVRPELAATVTAIDPECRFAGLGGTTETAIHSTICEVADLDPGWRSVPYGHPLPGQQCRIVDEFGRDRPQWVTGELWIGGASVAEGYVGDELRTAEKFLQHDGVRWYRTGDLARYLPEAVLEFLGRSDFQVQVNGHRIELGEIEFVLRSHPAVDAAVATTVGTQPPRLAAVLACTQQVDLTAIEEYLRERLPNYMVPTQLSVIQALPLSSNGKVDRAAARALLQDEGVRPEVFEPARGPAEQAVAELWSDFLRLPQVGRADNFFALGGDSLTATRILTALAGRGFTAQLSGFFRSPTLAEFAAGLEQTGPVAKRTFSHAPDKRFEAFPLTDIQRAYWLGRQPDFTLGGTGSYWYWEFDGVEIDLDRVEVAWNRLVERHEMMRAVISPDGTQRILPSVPRYRIPIVDAMPEQQDTALTELREMSQQILDVHTWPLFDIRAVRYGDGRVRLGFGFDYIVLDALSIMLIFAELSELYHDPHADLSPVELSFRDYLLNLEPDPAELEQDERYWSQVMADFPPAPALPLAVEPAMISRPVFERIEAALAPQQWTELRRRTARYGLTPSTVLATAFAEVMSAWSASPHIGLNVTMFDRRDIHPDVNNIVGDFTSLLLVSHRAVPGRSWVETVRTLQEQVWSGIEHNRVSAIWMLRELTRRSDSAEVLMPVVFTSTLGVSDTFDQLSIPFGEQVFGLSQTPQVLLDCQVVERDGELRVNWDYVPQAFPPGLIEAMFETFAALLDELSASDWNQIVTLDLPAEQRAVRARVNDTSAPRSGRLLHEGFFTTSQATPDAVAVVRAGQATSYGEVRRRALTGAARLRSAGARNGDLVIVNLPKGLDQIVAVLAVLAAGCVYVPVGSEHPADRRNRIAARAGATLAVTVDSEGGWSDGIRTLSMQELCQGQPRDEPILTVEDDLAYVIFTSGSTGEPKGVEITHGAAMNTIEDINARYAVGPADRVLQVSALDFDLSVYDIFGMFDAGGALVLIEEEERRDARRWSQLIAEHSVTIWNSVPALLDMLLVVSSSQDAFDVSSIRFALASGDWVGMDLPSRLEAVSSGALLVALGGATEAAIWSNALDVTEIDPSWRSIPYGYPLRNQEYRVVGPNGEERPDWVAGELWIGGAGVACGYRNDPDRTAHSFVRFDGRRWYRTGDQGRYLPDGMLEFLGRQDDQVKIRGHRIELGEIEVRLLEIPGVTAAIAGTIGSRGDLRLVAWVMSDQHLDAATLQQQLRATLPAYMVPDLIQQIIGVPLTANGKVDRSALAASVLASGIGSTDGVEDLAQPAGAVEEAILSCLDGVLDAPPRRNLSFVAAGGDSLAATRLIEHLQQRFGIRPSLRDIFLAPSLTELAARIERLRSVSPTGQTMEEGSL